MIGFYMKKRKMIQKRIHIDSMDNSDMMEKNNKIDSFDGLQSPSKNEVYDF